MWDFSMPRKSSIQDFHATIVSKRYILRAQGRVAHLFTCHSLILPFPSSFIWEPMVGATKMNTLSSSNKHFSINIKLFNGKKMALGEEILKVLQSLRSASETRNVGSWVLPLWHTKVIGQSFPTVPINTDRGCNPSLLSRDVLCIAEGLAASLASNPRAASRNTWPHPWLWQLKMSSDLAKYLWGEIRPTCALQPCCSHPRQNHRILETPETLEVTLCDPVLERRHLRWVIACVSLTRLRMPRHLVRHRLWCTAKALCS